MLAKIASRLGVPLPPLWVVALIAGAVASGFLTYRYMDVRHTAEIERIGRVQADALATQTKKVIDLERAQADAERALEDSYVRMSELRAARQGEIDRLSGDLGRAVGRLRRAGSVGSGNGTGLPGTTESACQCADLRAARDRLAGALERIVAGGAAIVADGQRAVDVASQCAAFAK